MVPMPIAWLSGYAGVGAGPSSGSIAGTGEPRDAEGDARGADGGAGTVALGDNEVHAAARIITGTYVNDHRLSTGRRRIRGSIGDVRRESVSDG
jgi:hypothetical protein